MSCLVVFTFPKGEACQARSGQEKSKAWSYLFRVFFHAWDWIIYIPGCSRLERASAGLPLLLLLPIVLLFHDTLCTFACPDWRRMGRKGAS